MRRVEIEPGINAGIVNGASRSSSNPFSGQFEKLAKDMIASLTASLESGDIGDIEAAGRLALASMCSLYASGDIPEKQMLSFLKSLAERKTPDPVQKVEQTSIVDMRVLVQSLISENPAALEDAAKKANEAKNRIAEKLQLTNGYELARPENTTTLPEKAAAPPGGLPISTLPLPGKTSTLPEKAAPLPEPDEIQNIRAGRSPQEGVDGFKRFSERASSYPSRGDRENEY